MVPPGKDAIKKRRRKFWLRLLLVIAVIILCGFGVWWAKEKLQHLFVKAVVEVQPAKLGQLSVTRPLPGWIIRDEVIISAPAAGRFQRIAKDSERVRLGAPVAGLQSGNAAEGDEGGAQSVPAPRAGLLEFRMDGLESVLTPRVLDTLDPGQLKALTEKPTEVQNDDYVNRGQPIFKIIDNIEKAYYLTHYVMTDLPKPLVPQMRITLAMSPTGPNISGKVVQVRGVDDVWVLIQLLNPSLDAIKERKASLLYVEQTHKGILLPLEAIVEREGEKGVWLSEKNRAQWHPVTVTATVNEQVIVDPATLDEKSLVVQNPSWLEPGQEIK